MSKIEEVAKALANHVHQGGDYGMTGEEAFDDRRDDYLAMARAAIEAMREPTEAMQSAAIEKIGYEVDWVGGLMGSAYSAGVLVLADAYRASIDAALSEEVER